MPDSQPLSRLYTGADAAMQQRQRTLHGHFLDNLAALTAFSPELAGTFGTRWTAAQRRNRLPATCARSPAK